LIWNVLAFGALISIFVAGFESGLFDAVFADESVRYIGETRVVSALPKQPVMKQEASLQWQIFYWVPTIILGLMLMFVFLFMFKFYSNIKLQHSAINRPESLPLLKMLRGGRGLTKAEVDLATGAARQRQVYEEFRAKNQSLRYEQNHRRLEDGYRVDESMILDIPDLNIREAFRDSTEDGWILGQLHNYQPRDGVNHPPFTKFNYKRSGHIGIIGGTGSGKTASSAMMVVHYAKKCGMHVIVLDGKGGMDWKKYSHIVEWHGMDKNNIHTKFAQINAVFQKRMSILEQYGAEDIYELPKRMPNIMVIVEEFGNAWVGLKNQDKKLHKEVEEITDSLYRMGRATGITLCLVDQAPQGWTQQMRGNTKYVLCYKLKGGVANTFNEYFADQLPAFGVFSQDNTFYRPWHAKADADMNSLPPLRGHYLNDKLLGMRTVPAIPDSNNGNAIGNGHSPEVGMVGTQEIAKGVRSGFEPIPPSLKRSFQRSRSWDDFCEEYIRIYPDTTQAQLRRAMDDLDAKGRGTKAFNGEAFRQWHRWHRDGNNSKAERVGGN
jgi:ABC-type oligopeptide transport system ATPase subunit